MGVFLLHAVVAFGEVPHAQKTTVSANVAAKDSIHHRQRLHFLLDVLPGQISIQGRWNQPLQHCSMIERFLDVALLRNST
jgi:hypothetical protein